MKTEKTLLGLAIAGAIVIACGSDPKKEPAVVAPPPAASETAPPAPVAPEAGATADAGAKPDKKAECEGFVDSANQTLDAERIAVDKVCKKDADCMPIKGRACAFNCVNAAIPKVEEKDWNESLQKVKDGPCKQWSESECSKLNTKPAPTCKDRKVYCDKGHCSLKD